jgi:hypothetical protein
VCWHCPVGVQLFHCALMGVAIMFRFLVGTKILFDMVKKCVSLIVIIFSHTQNIHSTCSHVLFDRCLNFTHLVQSYFFLYREFCFHGSQFLFYFGQNIVVIYLICHKIIIFLTNFSH